MRVTPKRAPDRPAAEVLLRRPGCFYAPGVHQVPSTQTLRAFEAAARHRSFTRAGEELGLTHGAISQRMRDLETRTGVKLFVRSNSGNVPTREAEAYLPTVRYVLQLLCNLFPPQPNGAHRSGSGDTAVEHAE